MIWILGLSCSTECHTPDGGSEELKGESSVDLKQQTGDPTSWCEVSKAQTHIVNRIRQKDKRIF